MRQSPITCDTLLIANADTKVKRRVPKLLLECSMRQFQNEVIVSQDDEESRSVHSFKDSCIYLKVLQMAQPHIIL